MSVEEDARQFVFFLISFFLLLVYLRNWNLQVHFDGNHMYVDTQTTYLWMKCPLSMPISEKNKQIWQTPNDLVDCHLAKIFLDWSIPQLNPKSPPHIPLCVTIFHRGSTIYSWEINNHVFGGYNIECVYLFSSHEILFTCLFSFDVFVSYTCFNTPHTRHQFYPFTKSSKLWKCALQANILVNDRAICI